jgi:hypothetical protein
MYTTLFLLSRIFTRDLQSKEEDTKDIEQFVDYKNGRFYLLKD